MAARASLHTVTASLTILIVQFIFDDETAGRFDAATRRVYGPRGRLTGKGGHTITPGEYVKEAALRDLRASLRLSCFEWVAERLPGAFADRASTSSARGAELILTEQAKPFVRDDTSVRGYEWVTGLRDERSIWTSEDLPGVRVRIGDDLRRQDGVITFAGRRSEVLSSPDLRAMGHDDLRWALLIRMDMQVGRTLVLWSLSELLSEYQARLARVRDLVLPSVISPGPTVKHLRRVRAELLRDVVDARAVASDLAVMAEDEKAFDWNACDMAVKDERWSCPSFLQSLRGVVSAQTRSVLRAETQVRDLLVADSSVMAAIASLHVQRILLPLSIVAVLVAVASVVIAVWSG